MTSMKEPVGPLSRRSDLPIAEGELDAHLARLVRRTSIVRQGFYVVVLLVALAGQVSGAVEALHIPVGAAIPSVAALELGGIVVLANADVRRRLGERAIASRILSAAIAAAAVAFNWLAHRNHLLGAFFAGMSALGYLVWLMHTENQRRDRLRVKGDLPPTTPAYETIGHWLRHPMLTIRARAMAKADPRLGLYDSLAAARAEIRRERRQAAIAKVLHRKIRAAVDPKTADIAIAVYDLDEIASRLADRADYDGLTSLIAADLAPERLAPNGLTVQGQITTRDKRGQRTPPGRTAADRAVAGAVDEVARELTAGPGRSREAAAQAGPASSARPSVRVTLPPDLREEVAHRLGGSRPPARREVSDAPFDDAATAPAGNDVSLRRRVHRALDANVLPGDQRDDAELIGVVFDDLNLTEAERLSATTYVQSWRNQKELGQRVQTS
jgi:hypothetical protein